MTLTLNDCARAVHCTLDSCARALYDTSYVALSPARQRTVRHVVVETVATWRAMTERGRTDDPLSAAFVAFAFHGCDQ